MGCCDNRLYSFSRRDALRTLSLGFGYLAFAGLAGADTLRSAGQAAKQGAAKIPARAKRVIYLCMGGGPSHVDTFDYKPGLIKADGQSYSGQGRAGARLLGSPWKFTKQGRSGLYVSELFPEVGKHADEMCLLRGMSTDVPAHAQAVLKMHTGSFQFVRPSMGAWALYGLGSVNENLPGFVTINPIGQGGPQKYGSAFLPATTQASPIRLARNGGGQGQGQRRNARSTQEPFPNIEGSAYTAQGQREQLDFVQQLNREKVRREGGDNALEGVIESYELAFRMQAEVPDVMDFSNEKPATLAAYGIGEADTDAFGKQCLLARRFAQAGVRFIEVGHDGWDTHRNLRADLERQSKQIDKPIAALLADLKQRGMLKDTLVVWGGEFGRTPYAQNGDGRDHNHKGFTMWMAGGGVKGGLSYGATDDVGYEAVDGRMDVHDFHATLLHLLGIDHQQLTFNHAGRDFRLTETSGIVAKGIIA